MPIKRAKTSDTNERYRKFCPFFFEEITMKSDINKMLKAVEEFHKKHSFDIGTKDKKTMYYRMNLLIEELGEISQSLTKGYPDEQVAEEHADLLILLLGNCITMCSRN